MGLFLAIVGWTLLLILAAVVLVIATPLHLRGAVSSTPPRVRLVIAPLGGLVPIRVPIENARGAPARPAKPKRKTQARRGGRPDFRRVFPEVPSLLTGLIGAFRIEYLRIDARFGLEDPADTGAVFGMLAPVIYGVPQGPRWSVAVAPDFGTPGVSGSAEGAISVTLAKMIPPAVRFGWRAFGPVT